MHLNAYIDHTLLIPTATHKDIATLCEEALTYHFFSVCIHSSYVSFARKYTEGSNVAVCSVVGFPLGAMSCNAKVYEAQQAINNGADEIDMVIHLGNLKSGSDHKIIQEITAIKQAIGDAILKVIIETCYLSDDEKKRACKLAVAGGANFVKTSTGFGSGGATAHDILLMKNAVKAKAQLKASGGIRDAETARKYIELGATRLGTSSGIAIVNGHTDTEAY